MLGWARLKNTRASGRTRFKMAPTSATVSTTVTPNSAYKDKSLRESNSGGPGRRRQEMVIDTETFLNRVMHHPKQERKRLSENYEPPVTAREGWWRKDIKETPLPGSYETDNFLEEIFKKPNTYRFKSDGRRREPGLRNKGSLLLPGAYQHEDLAKRLQKNVATYNFKAVSRDARDFMNLGRKDKDINVCPTSYSVEKHLTLTTDKLPSSHWYFRSQANRFPTLHFKPKDGPGPGNYEPTMVTSNVIIDKLGTSSFRSGTPRFKSAHTKVPGPGTYERTFQAPMPSTITKMGRQHGLFFSSAFEA
ncbi:protein STPG4-like [Liolophura sinensis]|uniref:protein STPG4-like n=1 Tax=Liolophura sinensis TaxID=3198878 RepID=UPI0031580388